MSFEALADAEYAREIGRINPSEEYILSDRDVWYRNPFYTGPKGRHPDDDCYDNEGFDQNAPAEPAAASATLSTNDEEWEDLPF
jgi:hypothetical protein